MSDNDVMRLMLLLFSYSAAMAQTQIAVANAASGVPGVVPNSLAQITLLPSDGPIKTINAADVAVQVQPAGGPPVTAQVLNVSGDYQLLILVPPSLPIGMADIRLFSDGNRTKPAHVDVLASNIGIYTQEGFGLGTVIDTQYSLGHPALPGQFVSLWTTGLGSAKPTVLLGGHAAPVSYAGPAPGYAGLDQINFQIPNDLSIPDSCYVSVVVRAGGKESYEASIPKSTTSGPCLHPFGLAPDMLAQLDGGGSVVLPKFLIRSAIWPGFTRQEYIYASTAPASSLTIYAEPQVADDVYYSCTQFQFLISDSRRSVPATTPVDLGSHFTLAGPEGLLDVPRTGSASDLFPAFYSAEIPATDNVLSPLSLPPPFFKAGEWRIKDGGGTSSARFNVSFRLPPPLILTNLDALGTVDRSADLLITWDPKGYSSGYAATASIYGLNQWFNGPSVTCRVPAVAGQITLPSALLGALPSGSSNYQLQVTVSPRPDSFPLLSIPLAAGGSLPATVKYETVETIPVRIK